MTILEIKKEFFGKIDPLDLDLIISSAIKKPREFVLAHPEYEIPKFKIENLKLKISRRKRGEPLAHILGHKEFFSLDFKVTKNTLIPRPETEIIVEEVLKLNPKNKVVIDVGTGSGNIIISLAKKIQEKNIFFGIDISEKALRIAKQNAKRNDLDEKIKFFNGDLLLPLIKNRKLEIKNSKFIILANLPYLSKKIYGAAPKDVKNYEPKSALYSPREGLAHYEKLLKQIGLLQTIINQESKIIILEISPEQKSKLRPIIKNYLPKAKIEFQKDLAGKWRVCKIFIN